ncbi:Retrovirus-related Pol polyprotein from transposon opus, partial [Mucuna pruriens]
MLLSATLHPSGMAYAHKGMWEFLQSVSSGMAGSISKMLSTSPPLGHHVHMKECDEWKIAFENKLRLYEWLVMPLRLTNAPSTFTVDEQCSLIGKCVVYILMIYLVILVVLLTMLCITFVCEMCTFCTTKLIYLGYIIGSEGVKVDAEKVKAIQN